MRVRLGARHWQPLTGPTGPLCDPTPWVANAVPFLVQGADQFRTAGPYALDSAAYAADVNEVEALGSLNSTTRTARAESHRGVLAEQSRPELRTRTQRLLGDEPARQRVNVTSSRFPGEKLYFDHFSGLTNLVREARIWAGIHVRNPDVQAANLGRDVEAYTHEHQFAFVH